MLVYIVEQPASQVSWPGKVEEANSVIIGQDRTLAAARPSLTMAAELTQMRRRL